MSVMLDLVGSLVIGAFVILMGIELNRNVAGTSDAAMANLTVQESIVDIVRNIESDFHKIGYGLVDPKGSIALMEPTHIRFRGDIDNDGVIDSVDWYLGAALTGRQNEGQRMLYRQCNGETPVGTSLGVSQFSLTYLTETGKTTAVPSQVAVIEMTLRLESPYKVSDEVKGDEQMDFAKGFWRQTRLASRNIKRHG
jgi:hypothetical protein